MADRMVCRGFSHIQMARDEDWTLLSWVLGPKMRQIKMMRSSTPRMCRIVASLMKYLFKNWSVYGVADQRGGNLPLGQL